MSDAQAVRRRRGLSRRQWLAVFAMGLMMWALALRYIRIGVNETGSLRHKVFLVIRGAIPEKRGEYVVFRWGGQGGFYHAGDHFTKLIAGIAGDRIEVAPDGLVLVSGRVVGYARPRASNGVPLEPVDPGVIPPGYVFVAGEADNSLDSRYKLVGLIRRELMIGTAYAIF